MSLYTRYLKLFFTVLSLFIAYYIIFIETEKYQSKTVIMIKNLSQEQSATPFGSMLLSSGSESMQDAKILEVYIKSNDMYNLINRDFNLSDYYSSNRIDLVHRLSDNSILPTLRVNKKNLLSKYSNDLSIIYDKSSSTLEIAFQHANAKTAQEVVQSITEHSGKALNLFEKKNAEVILSFLKNQERKKYRLFISSMQKLLDYQNRNNTIDPKIDVESKNSILTSLEGELIQKDVEYNSKLQYMNANTSEMKLLKSNIRYIQKSIQTIKKQITGTKGKKELNVNISDFALLESDVEFKKELYRQTLAKLEETSVLVNQNTRNLIVISQPIVADSYNTPNKMKDIFSIFIILGFLYGISTLIFSIIRDHKD